MEEKLGFNALREIQRKERDHTPLQPLPADFYLQVAVYFSMMNSTTKELAAQQGNDFAEKILHQRELEAANAREVVKDIFSRRLRKILVLAHEAVFSGAIVDTNLFTAEEREIFDSLSERLGKFNEKISSRLFASIVSPAKPDFARLQFTESVPAFMGADFKAYGPFEAGAEAEVPEKNAEVLLSRGSAKRA